MGYIQPTKCRMLNCSINGVDITQLLKVTKIFETICKAWITGSLVVADSTNVIDSLGLKGGEPVSISFDSPPQSFVYTVNLNLHSVEGEQSADSLRTQIYTMNLIGPEFFKDLGSLVNTSHSQQIGTDAITQIWNTYIGTALKVLTPSIGLLGAKSPWLAHNLKPLTAIEQIRKTLVFPGTNSGNTLLFRNVNSTVLTHLEDLMKTAPNVNNFIQKNTWGVNFRDPMLYNSIIAARAEVDPLHKTGRFGTTATAQAAVQGQQVFDAYAGIPVVRKIAQQVMTAVNTFNITAGSLGGSLNIQKTFTNLFDRATAPDTKTIPERVFNAQVKDSPWMTVKVPLQSGIIVTVGNSVNLSLVPPVGDGSGPSFLTNPLSGNYLAAHLCHEIRTDQNQGPDGTTTMQCIKVS